MGIVFKCYGTDVHLRTARTDLMSFHAMGFYGQSSVNGMLPKCERCDALIPKPLCQEHHFVHVCKSNKRLHTKHTSKWVQK